MKVFALGISLLLVWHPSQVRCEPVKADHTESWHLDKAGAKFEDFSHAVVDIVNSAGRDLDDWRHKVDEVLQKDITALDEWAQTAAREANAQRASIVHILVRIWQILWRKLFPSEGFYQHLVKDVHARTELVNNALSSSRSLCFTSKLDKLFLDLASLSDAISDPDLILQVEAFRRVIDSRRDPPLAVISTHDQAWDGFINKTTDHLNQGWTELQTVLKSKLGQEHTSELERITNYISSGFASTWDDIKVFTSTHHFDVQEIDRFIHDHPVIFTIFALILITGGLGLMVGPQLILALLQLIGFSPIGPVTGSLAAGWQSASYGGVVPKGSIFSLLQKLAMGGLLAPSGAQLMLGGVLVAAGGTIIYVLLDGRIEVAHDQKLQEGLTIQELD